MRRFIVLITIGVMLGVTLNVTAQGNLAISTSLSLEQGLSDRTVKKVIQDPFGYLWIGTRNGLNRYNGLNVLRYESHRKSQLRINAKDIKGLAAKNDGALVIQYESNRRFLDVLHADKTEAVRLFLNRENGIIGLVEEIYIQEKTGAVYVLSKRDSALFVQQLNENLVAFDSLYQIKDFEAGASSTFHLLVLDRGDTWIHDSQNGLLLVDKQGWIQNEIAYDSLEVRTQTPTSIFYQDRLGRLWLSFENIPGIWEYNEAADGFTPFRTGFDPLFYKNIWEDEKGNIVLAAYNQRGRPSYFQVSADDVVQPFELMLSDDLEITDIYSSAL